MAIQTVLNPKRSNVKRVEYDESTRKLTVHFKRAITYLYTGVAPRIWHRLLTSRDIGNFVEEHIIATHRGRRLRFVPA